MKSTSIHRHPLKIATLNENRSFNITGVRPGTYYAYAIITSDLAEEENAAA